MSKTLLLEAEGESILLLGDADANVVADSFL